MITIKNINEKYGDPVTITADTIEEAVKLLQDGLRTCGPEFAEVVVDQSDYEIVDDEEPMPHLEVCESNEWLISHSSIDFDGVPEVKRDDAANSFTCDLIRRLEDAGFDVEPALGQRATFHGWNGYTLFKHNFGAVGSFDPLTDKQCAAIEQALHDASRAMERNFDRQDEEPQK